MDWKTILVVRVGTEDRPAAPEDLADMASCLKEIFKGEDPPVLVSHHAVSFEHIDVPVAEDGTVNVVVVGEGNSSQGEVPGT